MNLENQEKEKRDRDTSSRTCPKCGNTDGVIVLAGSTITFYHCPKCNDKSNDTAN